MPGKSDKRKRWCKRAQPPDERRSAGACQPQVDDADIEGLGAYCRKCTRLVEHRVGVKTNGLQGQDRVFGGLLLTVDEQCQRMTRRVTKSLEQLIHIEGLGEDGERAF